MLEIINHLSDLALKASHVQLGLLAPYAVGLFIVYRFVRRSRLFPWNWGMRMESQYAPAYKTAFSCGNCKRIYRGVVPRGTRVDDHRPACPNCGVVGKPTTVASGIMQTTPETPRKNY